jgi:hypothetical protein
MKTLSALLSILLSGSAFAVKPYSMQNVLLLQPDSVLRERVEVADLSIYIKSVITAADTSLAGIDKPVSSAGFIVVAVRPDGRSKVWLDFSPTLPPAIAARLRSSLERVAPFRADGGIVVFALNSTLWGAEATSRPMPSPSEWNNATKSLDTPIEIEELIERVWPRDGS